jgi:hypothetical protein
MVWEKRPIYMFLPRPPHPLARRLFLHTAGHTAIHNTNTNTHSCPFYSKFRSKTSPLSQRLSSSPFSLNSC